MRLPYEEIWSALRIIPQLFTRCQLDLCLGDYCFFDLSEEMLLQLREKESCDKEILPVLFSERELFWQPNLQPSLSAWYTRFSTFIFFIDHYVELLKKNDSPADYLYAAILHDLKAKARHIQKSFAETASISSQLRFQTLTRFRIAVYPHILFFMRHAYMPVAEIHTAENRLDIMMQSIPRSYRLLQLLREPYWQLQLLQVTSSPQKASTSKNATAKEEKKTPPTYLP